MMMMVMTIELDDMRTMVLNTRMPQSMHSIVKMVMMSLVMVSVEKKNIQWERFHEMRHIH